MRYLLIAGCAVLAACGSKTNTGTATTNGTAAATTVHSGTSAAFASTFRSNYINSRSTGAREAATRAGNTAAANLNYTPLCTCTADKLLATKTEAELSGAPNAADIMTLTQACARDNPPA